jgi:DNA gyrase/topoisomerase IV subunit B
MAVKMMMGEEVIQAVISHEFQSANEALLNNNSVEISGFGKFVFNEKKAHKMMEKFHSQKALFEKMCQNTKLSEAKRRSAALKLQSALNNIESLKPKLNGQAVTDLRGMEERFDSPKEIEEGNSPGV